MAKASRPPAVLDGVLQTTVTLAPTVLQVQSGTPLAPSPDGWVASTSPVLFAGGGGEGGAQIPAYRSVSLEVHDELFTAGEPYTIEDVDEMGGVTYAKGAGPGVATSPSRIVLEGGKAAATPPATTSTRTSSTTPAS